MAAKRRLITSAAARHRCYPRDTMVVTGFHTATSLVEVEAEAAVEVVAAVVVERQERPREEEEEISVILLTNVVADHPDITPKSPERDPVPPTDNNSLKHHRQEATDEGPAKVVL